MAMIASTHMWRVVMFPHRLLPWFHHTSLKSARSSAKMHGANLARTASMPMLGVHLRQHPLEGAYRLLGRKCACSSKEQVGANLVMLANISMLGSSRCDPP